jgi:Lon protease-like protein
MAEVIPLFPLSAVVFPGLLLPLNVFEPRYRQLVQDLLARPEDERVFGVVAIRSGREVGVDGASELYEVGCTALVRRIEPQEDGRYHLVTTGARRFRLGARDTASTPYLRAEVEWIDEALGDADPGGLRDRLGTTFRDYLAALGAARGVEIGIPELPDDLTVLSYLVAATVVAEPSDKQALLEATTTADRVEAELVLLRRETGLLKRLTAAPAVDLRSMPLSPN